MMAGVGRAPVSDATLTDSGATVEAWVVQLRRMGLSEATKRTYAQQARYFAGWLAGQEMHRPVDVFTDPDARDYAVRDYKRWLLEQRRPATFNTALPAFTNLFTWLGLGKPNVSLATGASTREPRALSEDQVRAMLRAAQRRNPRDLALVTLMIGTGLRLAEVHGLNVSDVWVSDGKGELQAIGKGDKVRRVDLNTQSRSALTAWLTARRTYPRADSEPAMFLNQNGGRLAERTIRHHIRAIGDDAGVKVDDHTVAPHMLRHTFGTILARSNVDLSTVAELMGHSSIETTRGYSRPSRETTAAAVERINIDY